ncbi:AN1-type zinc finger protein 2B-like isoform X2 [Oratosquilla oratoria]|uniref:AN1-type zinc finger protein 2B-like isoform X2 n=1 Tax=Oratosquilla oratoria TaxID=337810 RepID=UPI003F75EB20
MYLYNFTQNFLPITCNLCNKIFCIDHHKYEAHSCSESYRLDVQVPVCPLCNQPVSSRRDQPPDLAVNEHLENNCQIKKKKIYTNKCSATGCKTKEVVPVQCDSCKLNFCLRHRHTTDHDCQGPKTRQERTALAALKRNQGNVRKGLKTSGPSGCKDSGGSSSRTSQPNGIRRYFSPESTGPRPTGNVPARAASAAAIQGNLSEDEALARAMAQSLQSASNSKAVERSSPSGPGTGTPQDDEDAMLAQAIAASLEQQNRERNEHRSNSDYCLLC